MLIPCEPPQLAHVRFGRRGRAAIQLLHADWMSRQSDPRQFALATNTVNPAASATAGGTSCALHPSYLLSRCTDGVGVLHAQSLDDDLRMSLVSLVLPSRG